MTQQLPDWLEAMVPAITQEDRDAALAFLQGDGDYWHSGVPEYLRGERIALGWEDDDPLVQAFAQHRRAALAKAAPLIVEPWIELADRAISNVEDVVRETGYLSLKNIFGPNGLDVSSELRGDFEALANAIRREVNRDE